MVIQSATEADLPEVRSLLAFHHLPLVGVDEHVNTMLVAKEGPALIGVAAVELYADGALLRSVAVAPAAQGQGVGHQLTDAALDLALTKGATTAFLLTTTAARFFPKIGFETISRRDVPASVQSSIEFQSACPASAIVMRKRLRSESR